MVIGLDVDGVLADFNTPFIARIIQVTGRDLFPPRPFVLANLHRDVKLGIGRQFVLLRALGHRCPFRQLQRLRLRLRPLSL